MSDLIDRQEAIDAFDLPIYNIKGRENAERVVEYLKAVLRRIKELPSAHPDGRYINADELIQRLKEAGHEEAAMALKMAGHERKKNLPSAQRWIPCSERLPEKEGWYITTVESEKTGKRRIENDLFAIDIALAHGLTPNRFCKDGHRQRTVAWCEFPEPWRGYTDEKI